MRKTLAIVVTCVSVVAIPTGCSQPKGLSDGTRISPQTHVASGQMLEAQRNFPGAENQYREAIDAQPDLTIAYHRLAELYLKLGRFDDARRTLRTAIEAGADEASLRNNLGFTLMRLEQFDEAEQMFEAALSISPQFHRARMNLALLHARAGRIDESVAEFEKLLPRADALYNVAVIRMQQRDYLTAAWGFGEAAQLNPNLPEARSNFEKARFLAQHSPQPQASSDFLAALNVPPQSIEPSVVQTTAVRSPAPAEVIEEREPVRATPTKVRTARFEPRIADAVVTPRPVEASTKPVETPTVQTMRDISTNVREAAVAIAPKAPESDASWVKRSTSAAASSQTTASYPAMTAVEPADCPEAPIRVASSNDPDDSDCVETNPMSPVQLTSARPTQSAKSQPMTPVTNE
ncbi:MAG: tetratricopeptide repeat protein [Phycisphaerales bacterium]|nr:tetratricopeptide repeat protein [Phycisphaerales bacterium]MCB9856340.1 tetratricopeptide repeat protein [Phycisphaerales bacterium]MCB9864012.1 tetratricopeptide repeat protein [Phycisphaerales bacterium]